MCSTSMDERSVCCFVLSHGIRLPHVTAMCVENVHAFGIVILTAIKEREKAAPPSSNAHL
jgi:hypothetical protein